MEFLRPIRHHGAKLVEGFLFESSYFKTFDFLNNNAAKNAHAQKIKIFFSRHQVVLES